MPACCCYMRLFSRHKHAESHITVSFSPGKGADIFFFLAGSQFDAQKSEVGDHEAEWRSSRWHCCRGASVVVTAQFRRNGGKARGRPRSLANSVVQTMVPGEVYPVLHMSPIGSNS
jgi:hypothetical protein